MSDADKNRVSNDGWASSFVASLAGLAGVGAVAVVDWVTGVELNLSILYVLPIGVATWRGGLSSGFVVSFVAAAVWFSLDALGNHYYSHPLIPFWNALVRLGFFGLTALLLNRIRSLTQHLESQVAKRTAALVSEAEQRKKAEKEIAEISHREQQRLAYELHDQLGGYLAGLAFQAKVLAENLARRNSPEAAQGQRLVGLVNSASTQVRELAHLLAPVQDAEGNPAAALAQLGREVETLFGITCRIDVDRDLPALTSESCHELYRIVQEAIRNAVQHGKAQSAEVKFHQTEEAIELQVTTDGKPWPRPDDHANGMGLRIMRYRAGLLGGTLNFTSSPDKKQVVVCRLPLESNLNTHTIPN